MLRQFNIQYSREQTPLRIETAVICCPTSVEAEQEFYKFYKNCIWLGIKEEGKEEIECSPITLVDKIVNKLHRFKLNRS